MAWLPTESYTALIGGITYKDVRHPVVLEGECIFRLTRNSENNQLGISFDIRGQDKQKVASIVNNEITDFNSSVYEILQGPNRVALMQKKTGRVWCEILIPMQAKDHEIDVSCMLHSKSGFPVFLHPNRSVFGGRNRSDSSTMDGLNFYGNNSKSIFKGIDIPDGDNGIKAIGDAVIRSVGNLYMISSCIRDSYIGIRIGKEFGYDH